MGKHTRGPWKVKFDEAIRIKDSTGSSVAIATNLTRFSRRDTNEVEANARLIAAAPDMYEALIVCRDMLAEYCIGACILEKEDGFCEDCEYMEAHNQAQAAIKKVEANNEK